MSRNEEAHGHTQEESIGLMAPAGLVRPFLCILNMQRDVQCEGVAMPGLISPLGKR